MIVPMKRLTLVGMKQDEERILKALQRVGAVEIIASGESANAEAVAKLENQIHRIRDASALLKPYAPKRRLGPRPEMNSEELVTELEGSLELVSRAEGIDREIASAGAEIEKRRSLIATLAPWRELSAAVEDIRSTRSVRFVTGFIREEAVEELSEAGYAFELFGDGARRAALVACHGDDYAALMDTLKGLEFSESSLPRLTGTAGQNIKRLEDEIEALLGREAELKAMLQGIAAESGRIARAGDASNIERDIEFGRAGILKTDATFVMDAWMRADAEKEVRAALDQAADIYCIEARDPSDDETPPSLMKNNKLIEPYESIVKMYAMPSYRGIDATPAMAPFYFLIFGMMLSDSGYGLALLIGGLLYVRLLRPREGAAKLAKVIAMGGVSAMLVGPFIGTFFGMNWNDIFHTDIFPLLLDPMHDVLEMTLLSCALGLVHMYVGMGIKIYMCFRDKDPATAIFDNLSWIIIISALLALFVLPAIKTAATVAALVGTAMILFGAGRSAKNPFKRLGIGLAKLYSITGYLSDMLSYVRVFALGLVSGAMGMIFNMIGGLIFKAFSGSVLGTIVGVILSGAIILALHIFSLFINTLGAYAHCARLQFIEFFGKFYEADGRAFRPLRFNTSYVEVNDK